MDLVKCPGTVCEKLNRQVWYLWIKRVKPALDAGDLVESRLPIYVVIPAVDKDVKVLPHVVDGVRNHVRHPISAIVVVAPQSEAIRSVCEQKGCVLVDENSVLPVTKQDIDYVVDGLDRSGWLFQQFLKWSGDGLGEHSHYLVVDADTVFIRPQVFERDGKVFLNCSDEYHRPYFDVYERLLHESARFPLSFTSHQMLYHREWLGQLKETIECKNRCAWYQAILKAVDRNQVSAHSEYETYGQYVYSHYRDSVHVQYWFNLSLPRHEVENINHLTEALGKRYKSISFHEHNP